MISTKPMQETVAREEYFQVPFTGHLLLDNPMLNKGSAFTEEERRELGLMGLLPPHPSTVDEQLARTYENYRRKDNDLYRMQKAGAPFRPSSFPTLI